MSDGIIDENYLVKNDETIQILCEQSLIQARAGCDIIAPSDMMDGRVKLIRQSLDRDGFDKVSIMSYSAKYASNFYSPFRQAIGSDKNLNSQNPHSKKSSDKKNYQMDYRNKNEAWTTRRGLPAQHTLRLAILSVALPFNSRTIKDRMIQDPMASMPS